MACGLYGRSILDDLAVEGDSLVPPIPREGVLPLPFLGHDGEPLLRLLFCRQFPVVLEDDRWRVASLKRHLVGTLHIGDAVTDE